MNEYEVIIHVTGTFKVFVKAFNPTEAKEKAEYEFSEADFGMLQNIDGEVEYIN